MMKRYVPIKLAVVVMLATAVGVVLARAVGQPTEPTQISGDWTVDLRTVLSVGGLVVSGVWWLSSVLRGFSDRMRDGEQRFARIEDALKSVSRKLETLPCNAPQGCPDPDKELI